MLVLGHYMFSPKLVVVSCTIAPFIPGNNHRLNKFPQGQEKTRSWGLRSESEKCTPCPVRRYTGLSRRINVEGFEDDTWMDG
jgi:hypothetical protein